MENLQNACPYKARGLMNGRVVSIWYTGTETETDKMCTVPSDIGGGISLDLSLGAV